MNAIVAVDKNWSIGKDDKLLFNISDDLKRFKALTSGNIVVMGRKTFESLPIKPLPNRINVVITNNKDFSYPNVITINDIKDVKKFFKDKKIYIIGGEAIYKQFLKFCDIIHVTKIQADGHGNKFFPNLDIDDNFKSTLLADLIDNDLRYQYLVYKRVKK